MKKIMFLISLIILLALPVASYAETVAECTSNCMNKCQALGSGKVYSTCLEKCLKGCTKAENAEGVRMPKITDPRCCYDDRRIRVGKCEQLYPFFNVLNGQCYSTLEECKEHDGDANRKTGMGFCIQCIECFPGSK